MDLKNKTLLEILSLQTKLLDVSDIQLTEDEKESILNQALAKKREKEEYAKKANFEKVKFDAIEKTWKPSEVIEWAGYNFTTIKGEKFIIDDENHYVVKLLGKYFSNDLSFEKMGEGYSLNKGLLICGNVGTGKSSLMKAFSSNKKAPYQVVTCRLMADKFSSMGAEVLHTYSDFLNVTASLKTFYQKKSGICFDDLGTERIGKHYADGANVMEQILLNRYDNNLPFKFTHITTNKSVDEIEQMYGTRVRSRMKEMFNMIVLDGKDRRK